MCDNCGCEKNDHFHVHPGPGTGHPHPIHPTPMATGMDTIMSMNITTHTIMITARRTAGILTPRRTAV